MKLRSLLGKPALPALFFYAGVTYDTITLTRIDRFLDNLILFLYLISLGLLVALTGRAGVMRRDGLFADFGDRPAAMRLLSRAKPYYPMAIQFLLGGLFSAYTIYYFRSASWGATAVFFGLLVGLLVANEFLHDRLSNFRLLLSLYALVTFSFFTFFLPVLTGWMNTAVFLLGAALSAAVTRGLVKWVYRGRSEELGREQSLTTAIPLALILMLVGFYFLKLIPPVPLSLKLGGVYQEVTRVGEKYRLSFEKGRFYEFFKRSDNPYRGRGPAYCFTAVFAPVALQTTIYHRWQYRPSRARGGAFATSDLIPIRISGGREGGYRGYTVKQRLIPGDWRVDVETGDGRLIGRVKFRVEEGVEPLLLETIVY